MAEPESREARRAILANLATVAAGAAGGFAAWLAGLPLPWMTGPLATVAVLAVAGQDVRVSRRLTPFVFMLLGISAGAGVSPESLAAIGRWPASILVLALAVPAVTAAGYVLLRRLGWDRDSALLASFPGALSMIVAMAMDRGADVTRITIVQTIRVVILVLVLPLAIAGGVPVPATEAAPPATLALLVCVAGFAGFLAQRAGMPGGYVIGAMMASSLLHGTGMLTARLPDVVTAASLVVLGCMVGARFAGTPRDLVFRSLLVGIAMFLLTGLLSALAALAASWATGLPLGQTLLAFAPGGLEAMVIMAALLHLDPAYVGLHHVLRFVGIGLLSPMVVRRK